MATTTNPVKLEKSVSHETRSTSLWRETLRNIRRQRSAMIGIVIIGLLIFTAIFAPVIATHDPLLPMLNQPGHTGRLPARPPCIHLLGCPADEPQHLMGLDLNARDLFSRVVYGSRVSLVVGFTSVIFAIVVGTVFGLISGYAGGWVDNVIMRCMDVLLAFPSLLLSIAIVTVLGPGLQNALLAIAIVSIPAYARLARASVLSVKEYEYVMANRALGASPKRILFIHIFPNALTPLIVQGTLGIGTAVLDAAALSFIGLGHNHRHRNGARCSVRRAITSSPRRIWSSSPALPSCSRYWASTCWVMGCVTRLTPD